MLSSAADSSLVLASLAGCVRWVVSPDGWRGLFTYLACSLLVTWGAWLWLFDEHLTEHRSNFYTLLFAFLARDILVVISGMAVQVRIDPIGYAARVWAIIRRTPPP